VAGDSILQFGERRPGIRYRVRPGSYAVVLDGAGGVALIYEDDEWGLPGGGKESSETPEETLQREVREECGCTARIVRSLGQAVEFTKSSSGEPLEVHGHYFLAEFVGAATVSWHPFFRAQSLLVRRSQAWAIRSAVGT